MTSISADGATETIYIREDGSTLYWNKNNGGDTQISSFPITITNTNGSPGSNILKVYFTTTITFTTNTTKHFVCGSDGIQFGSASLNPDGSRSIIVIDSVTGYPGLIQNGTVSTPGNSNIYVYNIQVITSNESTLAEGGGWIGHAHFSNGVTNNYIVNCSSTGDIADYGGGIVGGATGGNIGGTLVLRGCSSSGTIGTYAGGIAGYYAGESFGSVTCENCWSIGSIGQDGGGIFGGYAGVNRGYALAEKCYSEGTIGQSGGGICGSYAGESIGTALVQDCYSRGAIQTGGGGIFGANAEANASNSYSAGSITTAGTGIYGSNKLSGNESQCYAANGNWSSVDANEELQMGTPDPVVGNIWVAAGLNQPYELTAIGYTPYTQIIIVDNALVQSYAQTIQANETTVSGLNADASGNAFTLLQIKEGDPGSYATITISAQTGAISTTAATAPGTYTVYVRSIGSYNITQFVLTVTGIPTNEGGEATATTCCQSTTLVRGLDYAQLNNYRIGNRLLAEQAQNSKMKYDGYSQFVKMKMAQNQR